MQHGGRQCYQQLTGGLTHQFSTVSETVTGYCCDGDKLVRLEAANGVDEFVEGLQGRVPGAGLSDPTQANHHVQEGIRAGQLEGS